MSKLMLMMDLVWERVEHARDRPFGVKHLDSGTLVPTVDLDPVWVYRR